MPTGLVNRRITTIAVLGFASGLPLALSDSTMQAWLTESGAEVTTIGVFSLVGLPYVFKFLWAPLLDRFQPGWPGRRRDWVLVSQLLLIALLAYTGLADLAERALLVLAACAFLIAFMSATQDIAIDAYRAEVLEERERGFGAAVTTVGYRIAMLASGAGALILADRIGFGDTYLVMAMLLGIGIFATVGGPGLSREIEPPRTLAEAVGGPLRAFFSREGAMALLMLVFLYKLGDAFAGRLSTTFLLRELEFSLSEVGTINKGLGLAASIGGALFGGLLMARFGLFRSLLGFAWLQAVTNIGFCALAIAGKSYIGLVIVVGLENLTGGMGTAAFVALLMALCDRRFTATQFAMLTAVASLGRVVAGPNAGLMVDIMGWAPFFALTFVIALPAIVILRMQRARIESLDAPL